jgi:cation:H+ antiporter
MTTPLLVWFAFGVCALLIGAAGPSISRNADIIADRTGLSANWIGLILLGTITSLPELATGITSVTFADVPNIAVGDVLGSVVFNLLILVAVDFLFRKGSVYQQADIGHILAAGWGIILVGFVGLSLIITDRGTSPAIGHVGIYTPIIIGLYLLALRSVFSYERRHRAAFVGEASERYPDIQLNAAIVRFVLASIVVLAAGIALPYVASALADIMGWQKTFVGTLLVAGATSLPELVVTLSAVRFGALNLAIANLLGSNLFDVLIIAVDDLFYLRGPLLADVSASHAASTTSGVIMSGLVIVSLLYRPTKRLFRTVGWTSLGLFVIYLLNSYVLFLFGG